MKYPALETVLAGGWKWCGKCVRMTERDQDGVCKDCGNGRAEAAPKKGEPIKGPKNLTDQEKLDYQKERDAFRGSKKNWPPVKGGDIMQVFPEERTKRQTPLLWKALYGPGGSRANEPRGKLTPFLIMIIISEKEIGDKPGDGFYFVGVDESKNIIDDYGRPNVMHSNMILSDDIKNVGHEPLQKHSYKGMTWYLTGNDQIDQDIMPNLDGRWKIFKQYAPKQIMEIYDRQEDINFKSENAQMVNDFCEFLAGGGDPKKFQYTEIGEDNMGSNAAVNAKLFPALSRVLAKEEPFLEPTRDETDDEDGSPAFMEKKAHADVPARQGGNPLIPKDDKNLSVVVKRDLIKDLYGAIGEKMFGFTPDRVEWMHRAIDQMMSDSDVQKEWGFIQKGNVEKLLKMMMQIQQHAGEDDIPELEEMQGLWDSIARGIIQTKQAHKEISQEEWDMVEESLMEFTDRFTEKLDKKAGTLEKKAPPALPGGGRRKLAGQMTKAQFDRFFFSSTLRTKTLSTAQLQRRFPIVAYMIIGRNVANVQEIEQFLGGLMTRDERIDKWLGTAMRKWILRSFDKEKPYQMQEGDPEWMKGKTDLVALDLQEGNLHERIEHVIDFMKAQIAANPNTKFDNFQVDQAFKQSADWTEKLLKKKTNEEVEGTDYKSLKTYDTGFSWQDLTSANSLAREGKLMGHCVGGYWDRVKNKAVRIISLRDKKNEPHCTIELERTGKINQIKGKQNSKVNDEYMPYVVDLLNSKIVQFKRLSDWDRKQNGLLQTKAGYMSVNGIPAGTIVEHDLDIKDFKDVELPENLTIKGNLVANGRLELKKNLKVTKELDISGSSIYALPEGLDVRDLNIFDTQIEEIPRDIKIRGNLMAKFSQLIKLPDGLTIPGEMDISHTPIEVLPKKLKVGGELDLMETQIKKLPKDLQVGDAIYLDDDWNEEGDRQVEVPENLKEQIY